jgi:Ca-activated chloride channel family protein
MQAEATPPSPPDPIVDVLSRQTASGLWQASGESAIASTVHALLALLRLGVTAAHPVFGAQIKKAIDALLPMLAPMLAPSSGAPPAEARLHELAFGVVWLAASGRRTRQAIEAQAHAAHVPFAAVPEAEMRERIEALATA